MELELHNNQNIITTELIESKEEPIVPRIDINNKELFIYEPSSTTLTDSVIDGDEHIAYHSIHRNEPTRVIIGMGNIYHNLGRYIQEEINEEEGREWWGNNDY